VVFKVRIHEYKGREMGDENRGVRFEHGWIWSSAGEEWVHSSILSILKYMEKTLLDCLIFSVS